jgi:hypothetical protein
MKPEIREQVAAAIVCLENGWTAELYAAFPSEHEWGEQLADAAVTAYQAAVLPDVETALEELIACAMDYGWKGSEGRAGPIDAETVAARARVLAAVKGEG